MHRINIVNGFKTSNQIWINQIWKNSWSIILADIRIEGRWENMRQQSAALKRVS